MPNSKLWVAHKSVEGSTGHETGRQLLEQLYQDAVGQPLPEIAVMPLGKPYFVDSPWHFSITHTRHHAFCAISDCPVGIDAEEVDRSIRPGVIRRTLSRSEFARWQQCPDHDGAFLRLWVLKEAAAKLSGKGLQGFPDHTDFDPADPRVQILYGCYVAVLTEE